MITVGLTGMAEFLLFVEEETKKELEKLERKRIGWKNILDFDLLQKEPGIIGGVRAEVVLVREEMAPLIVRLSVIEDIRRILGFCWSCHGTGNYSPGPPNTCNICNGEGIDPEKQNPPFDFDATPSTVSHVQSPTNYMRDVVVSKPPPTPLSPPQSSREGGR